MKGLFCCVYNDLALKKYACFSLWSKLHNMFMLDLNASGQNERSQAWRCCPPLCRVKSLLTSLWSVVLSSRANENISPSICLQVFNERCAVEADFFFLIFARLLCRSHAHAWNTRSDRATCFYIRLSLLRTTDHSVVLMYAMHIKMGILFKFNSW